MPQEVWTYGVPTVILAFIGIALWRGVWPYAKSLIDRMLTRMEELQKEHKAEREQLLKEHKAEREQMLAVMNQLSAGFANTTSAIGASTAALKELTDAVEERKSPRPRQERQQR